MIKQKFKSSLGFQLGFDKVQYKLDHQQQVRVEILPIFHLYKFSPVCPFHVESKISNFCCKSVPGNNFPWIELYAKFNTLAPLWTSEVCTIIWSLNFKLIFQQCFKSAKNKADVSPQFAKWLELIAVANFTWSMECQSVTNLQKQWLY